MNKGKALHQHAVNLIASLWSSITSNVFIEHYIKNEVKTFIDVFIILTSRQDCSDKYMIGIEVELSTRHILENVRKDFVVGCDEIHLVCPTAKLRNACRSKVIGSSLNGNQIIHFPLLKAYKPLIFNPDPGIQVRFPIRERGK